MNKPPDRKYRSSIRRFFYGIILLVIFPLFLVFWAGRLQHIRLPDVPDTPAIGAMIASAGVVILIFGIWPQIEFNITTAQRESYERKGIYRYISHPVYLGFFAVCVGVSILFGSAGGLWVVSPVIALVCTTLIWGYERPRAIKRYGDAYFDHTIRIPNASDDKPGFIDFVSIVLLVYMPWLLVYQGIASYIGVVNPVWHSTLKFEEIFPVYELFAIPYMLTYPVVFCAPLLARTTRCQRKFCISVILALLIVIPFYLTFPIVAEFRPLEPTTIWGDMIILQHSVDNPATAFPAFHVVWAFLAAEMMTVRFPRFKLLNWGSAWLVAISCWATGMHAILDVFAGSLVYLIVSNYEELWPMIRARIQKVSNSWNTVTLGPLRIINHYKYSGLAGFVCVLLMVSILGENNLPVILFLGLISIGSSVLLAQVIEGSENLKRPFGYYESIIGAALGAIIIEYWLGIPWMIFISAFCIVAPMVCVIGRMRCLVHGCCHGGAANEAVGIIVTQAHTRICSLTQLCGIPVHPTQFYSIMGNLFIGMVMFRMMAVGSQSANVIGVYLILSSLARFVEETYRGEPQTPEFGGLNLYQWLSIACLVLGSLFTMVPSTNVTFSGFSFSPIVWGTASVFGILTAFLMSVDFPNSSKRFAKLT